MSNYSSVITTEPTLIGPEAASLYRDMCANPGWRTYSTEQYPLNTVLDLIATFYDNIGQVHNVLPVPMHAPIPVETFRFEDPSEGLSILGGMYHNGAFSLVVDATHIIDATLLISNDDAIRNLFPLPFVLNGKVFTIRDMIP